MAAQVIVHLAAVTHTNDEKQYFFVNTELTKRLLAVCRPGQRFIFVSSQSAHPDGGAYAHSKWLAEAAVRTSGLDFTIIRLAQVYGSKSGEGIDGLIAFARRTHLLPDIRHHGSAAYAPIAAEIVLVNTPGVTTSDLSRFTYTRRRRPLYPFELDAAY